MMEAVRARTTSGRAAAPPFERFYEAHRDEIFRYLVRLLDRDLAEDAFQETFLRALRGYAELRHADHLRAWAFTIATRVALDERRRAKPTPAELPDVPTHDELPRTERAAVVLRYGYDLDYADIAQALDSSEEAARQAASSGVRRLRRKGAA